MPVQLKFHVHLELVNDISNDISNLTTHIHQLTRLLPYSQTTNKTIQAATPHSDIYPKVTLTLEKLTLGIFLVIYLYTSEIAKTLHKSIHFTSEVLRGLLMMQFQFYRDPPVCYVDGKLRFIFAHPYKESGVQEWTVHLSSLLHERISKKPYIREIF